MISLTWQSMTDNDFIHLQKDFVDTNNFFVLGLNFKQTKFMITHLHFFDKSHSFGRINERFERFRHFVIPRIGHFHLYTQSIEAQFLWINFMLSVENNRPNRIWNSSLRYQQVITWDLPNEQNSSLAEAYRVMVEQIVCQIFEIF